MVGHRPVTIVGDMFSPANLPWEPVSSILSEDCMRFPVPTWLGRMALLVVLAGGVLVGGVLAGVSAGAAADRSFPYDSTLLLEAKPMKGSKRVPILQIESRGDAAIDLWCNRVQAQLVVVDNTITVILGATTEKQCDPDRMQADEDLKDTLQQVANWSRDGDLLVLQGARSLRFRLSSN
jgi:heat shock protein HslJ